MNLESLLSSFKDILTPSNYDNLVGVLTTEVTARLEKVIFKSTFNRVSYMILSILLSMLYKLILYTSKLLPTFLLLPKMHSQIKNVD